MPEQMTSRSEASPRKARRTMSNRTTAVDLVRWCAYAGMVVALPTALWRLPLTLGVTLGTPAAWREEQGIPGAGTWYLLLLSVMQLAAIGCMFFLTVEPGKVTPRWLPARLRRLVPAVVGGAGIAGALVLALLVTMSVIAWDKVDPFAGADYDAWAWLCAVCYLLAALWPPLLGAASVGYLRRHRRPRTTSARQGSAPVGMPRDEQPDDDRSMRRT